MQRLAGIATERSAAAAAHRAELVTNMLDRLRPARHSAGAWHARVCTAAGASLGEAGPAAPAICREGDVIVAVDGHVYDRTELGNGTAAAGVLRSYLRHGFQATLSRLNGDFAIAVLDGRSGTMHLARDRWGVRPLYYTRPGTQAAGDLAFASRPRALLTLPGVPRDVDPRFVATYAASHYRLFDNRLDGSPYASIARLPPAHRLEWRDGRVRVSRWWTLEDGPDLDDPPEVLAERYRALLLDAVAIRVRAFERPAFTLSGGMDSSSVTGCAARAGIAAPVAYSAVYDDREFDETDEILAAIDELAGAWTTVRVGNELDLDELAGLIRDHDEPVATATWIAHARVCARARADGADGLLGGLGGDELNAGEYEHFPYFFADLERAGDHARWHEEVAAWAGHHDHPVFRKSAAIARREVARLTDPRVPGGCRPDRRRLDRYRPVLAPAHRELLDGEPVMEHPFGSCLRNRTWQDLTRETMPCCLRAADRQCAAAGIDHAEPFLDHRLAEFMYRVPGTLKIRRGVSKHLLREAMAGIVPEATRTRVTKTGWNAPAHRWFAGPGRERLLDLVGSRSFRERGIYVEPELRRLIDEHEAIVRSGRHEENHMMLLWQVANLELWLREVDRGLEAPVAAAAKIGV